MQPQLDLFSEYLPRFIECVILNAPTTGPRSLQEQELIDKLVSKAVSEDMTQSGLLILMTRFCKYEIDSPYFQILENKFVLANKSLAMKTYFKVNTEKLLFSMLSKSREFEKRYPQSYYIIINKLNGQLFQNLDLMLEIFKREDFYYFSDSMVRFIKSEVKRLATMELTTCKLDKEKLVRVLALSVYKLSEVPDDDRFATRERIVDSVSFLVDNFVKSKLSLGAINLMLGSQIQHRLGDGDEFEVMAHYIDQIFREKRSVDFGQGLGLLGNLMRSDLSDGHPVFVSLGNTLLQTPEALVERILLGPKSSFLRTLLTVGLEWYWKQLFRSHKTREQLSELSVVYIEKGLGYLERYLGRHSTVDIALIHRGAMLITFLVEFGYFKEEARREKYRALSAQLNSMIPDSQIALPAIKGRSLSQSSKKFSKFDCDQFFNANQIEFVKDKRIGVYVVEYYLPEYNAIFEQPGAYQFTRKKLNLRITQISKVNYCRRLGFTVLESNNPDKPGEEDQEKAMLAQLLKLKKTEQ
jgi:hypothetical protein